MWERFLPKSLKKIKTLFLKKSKLLNLIFAPSFFINLVFYYLKKIFLGAHETFFRVILAFFFLFILRIFWWLTRPSSSLFNPCNIILIFPWVIKDSWLFQVNQIFQTNHDFLNLALKACFQVRFSFLWMLKIVSLLDVLYNVTVPVPRPCFSIVAVCLQTGLERQCIG